MITMEWPTQRSEYSSSVSWPNSPASSLRVVADIVDYLYVRQLRPADLRPGRSFLRAENRLTKP
jgi:hypothetical protein